jgi:integrase
VKVRIRRELDDLVGIREDVTRIERELQAGQAPQTPSYPSGTLGWLMEHYRRSDWWTGLKPATQASYERAFAAFSALQDRELKWLERPRILRLRDEAWLPAYGRWMANMAVTVLGILLKFAKDKGHINVNPLAEKVRKLRRKKGGAQPNRPWTSQERHVVLSEAPAHVRLVLTLAMCTGLRKADLFDLTMGDIKDGDIAVVTSKRDQPVHLPVHPLLAQALAERKGPELGKVCIRADKLPYTPDGFDTVWHRLKTKLEKAEKIGAGLTLHGLRHTLGTMLKEAGMADGDIADVLGQATVSMARHYSKNAKLTQETRDRIVALQIGGSDAKRR